MTCALLLVVFINAAIMVGCRNRIDGGERSVTYSAINADETVMVETMVLSEGGFYEEINSNGRLQAKRKLRLVVALDEELVDVKVRNGDYVVEGQTLAVLCSDKLKRQLEAANLRLMGALLDMEDVLLGQGFRMKDSLVVPDFTWQMAGVRSGYFEAFNHLRSIEREKQKTIISAPFDGVVADLQLNVNEVTKPGDVFCTVIDQAEFLVTFPLMEQELEGLERAMPVKVSPFSRPDMIHTGYVQTVNPVVDKHGQVELTAVVKGAPGLLEGMNVNVNVRKKVPGQLIVPRLAVMSRDGESVLFKYSHGMVIWTYINIMYENSTHYSVLADQNRMASLKPGDTIIISNNFHLAHGSSVKRKIE